MKRFYLVTRDLHLYFGLFISPFVLVFAISVIFLVHSWIPGGAPQPASRRAVDLSIPAHVGHLKGREQLAAIRGVLDQLGVSGEVGFVRGLPKEHRLIVPVGVPGRETTVDLDLETRSATITKRSTGVWDGLVYLHKMPGPHNTNIRVNTTYMRVWKWFADATVYLLLFISISGIYMWTVLRGERRIGLVLIAAGAFSFFGVIYAISH